MSIVFQKRVHRTSRRIFRIAIAGVLVFSAAAIALPVGATVYAPGLVQVRLSGSMDKTTSAAVALANGTVTNVPGAIMASTSGSATNPYNGQSYAWSGNTTWAYFGQMYFEAGKTYYFGKYVDDAGYLVVDGTKILDNGGYQDRVVASYAPAETGWKDVDFRFGNGGGGAGCVSSTIGFGYNTDGISSFTANTFKDGGPWSKVTDPGDASLLRTVYSESSLLSIDSVSADGSDLVVTASFTGMPGAGALTAYYGPGDGGMNAADWDSSAVVATPSAGDTASATYRIAGAGSAAFVAFRLNATAGTAIPVYEWSDTFALAENAPSFKIAVDSVASTNLTVTATCLGLGEGATTVDASVQLATDSAFAHVVQTKALALSGLGSESVSFTGVATDTTYYLRVVGTNDLPKAGMSSTVSAMTGPAGPAFTVSVDATHVAPTFTLAFTDTGIGSRVTQITALVSASGSFGTPDGTQIIPVDFPTMPTNITDLLVAGLPSVSPLYFRFIAENDSGNTAAVDVEATLSANGDNVWSGHSEDIASADAYVFEGGLPASDKTLYFTTPAGQSPVIDQDTAMPSLRFTVNTASDPDYDSNYRDGFHSFGYDLSGAGMLSFTAERPIVHATKGTNIVRNLLLFNRTDGQTVYLIGRRGRLDLTGELMLPEGVSNTTMRVNGEGGEVHFGGPSPDFMGRLYLESSVTLSLDNPNAMTNVTRIFFGGGWGSYTYLKNNTGAPMTFPLCAKVETNTGWESTRACFSGAPMLFPEATLTWYVRGFDGSTFDADVFVKDLVVGKNDNGGDAGLDKRGTGTLSVSGTTSWSAQDVKHYIRLRGGCFWPQTTAGLPPSGEFYVPVKNEYGTLGLGGDYSPRLDGSSTPRVFQETSESVWGFTGFGGDRTVCWDADPTLNLTNTTSNAVSTKLADSSSVNSVGKTYNTYYAYPSRLMFGNRSEFADGTVLFRNPIRYELNQNWDTTTYFESTNHVVAARMRGSLKLGNRDKTWNFSGRNFGGYLALEADNADFTGRVNVYEKGNLLVNSNLVARSATVQSGCGLGGIGSLSTEDGTTVKSGGALFGGEWNRGGTLTIGGKLTMEGGSALRVEAGSSDDGRGCVKLAAGSMLKLATPIYVDVDTDPRVSPVRGASCKILDWSEASFDSGAAPTRADFVARPEQNPDLKKISVFVRGDGLYVGYVTVRCPVRLVITVR